jgi:hypothetical protein
MKRFSVLVVVAGLGLSACATGAASTVDLGSSRSTPVVDRPSATPTGEAPLPAKSPKKQGTEEPHTCSSVSGGDDAVLAQLVDVRVGAHDGYDRVTFEFAPPSDGRYFGLPSYEIHRATPPITQDGSGDPVAVDGESFAVIVFHGASGVDSTADEYTITYEGPREFTPGFEVLAEATQTGDFEATLSWAFGLNEVSCWSVLELDDPMRVAIDFSH